MILGHRPRHRSIRCSRWATGQKCPSRRPLGRGQPLRIPKRRPSSIHSGLIQAKTVISPRYAQMAPAAKSRRSRSAPRATPRCRQRTALCKPLVWTSRATVPRAGIATFAARQNTCPATVNGTGHPSAASLAVLSFADPTSSSSTVTHMSMLPVKREHSIKAREHCVVTVSKFCRNARGRVVRTWETVRVRRRALQD